MSPTVAKLRAASLALSASATGLALVRLPLELVLGNGVAGGRPMFLALLSTTISAKTVPIAALSDVDALQRLDSFCNSRDRGRVYLHMKTVFRHRPKGLQ